MIIRLSSLIGCAIVLGATGCDSWSAPKPNIVLVTIDALRADHLSSYGHERRTSPFLDNLAAGGIRFERAYSTTSWTAPAIVSMLTSLPPRIHGVEHGSLSTGKILYQEVVPDAAPMLAEILQTAGYRTFGVTTNLHLESRLGFARGFDRYVCLSSRDGKVERSVDAKPQLGFADAKEVHDTIVEWKDEIIAAQPYFLWIHLFDPHAPYRYHDDFTPEFVERDPRFRKLEQEVLAERLKRRGVLVGNEQFRYVEALYDGEIRRTDAVIERIVKALGISLQEDLMIVTADHGEEFLEHGGLGHGNSLFEEVIRIPLIMSLPAGGHAGRVVGEPVSILDILPSVLEIARIEVPEQVRGRSLLPLLRGDETASREVITTLSRRPDLESTSITQGSWKYIHRRGGAGYRRLYDLIDDPGEKNDLLDREPFRAAALTDRLGDEIATAARHRMTAGREQLSDESIEQLKSLGYLE